MTRPLLRDLAVYGGGTAVAFLAMQLAFDQIVYSIGAAVLVLVALLNLMPRTLSEAAEELLDQSLRDAESSHRKIGELVGQIKSPRIRALLGRTHETSAEILDLMRADERLRQEAAMFQVSFLDRLHDRLELYVRLRNHHVTRAEADLDAMEREDFPGALEAFEGFRQSLFARDLRNVAGARSGPTFVELNQELWGDDAARQA